LPQDHPLGQGKLTLKRYAAADHLLVLPRGNPNGIIDRELAKLGLTRIVRMTVNNFSSAPPILAAFGMILTLPKRIVETHAPLYDLHVTACPVTSVQYHDSAVIVWHRKLTADPVNVWFRQTLLEISQQLRN